MMKVMIMAGEASGDLHGANLVREISRQDPSIAFYGVGSRNMKDAGVRLLADASEISVVGATEVLTHLRPLCRAFNKLKRFLTEERPDLLILIDFPDFNIMLGLCIGHDALFLKNIEGLTTVFAVKDRVTGHNPVAALYTSRSYYQRLAKVRIEAPAADAGPGPGGPRD